MIPYIDENTTMKKKGEEGSCAMLQTRLLENCGHVPRHVPSHVVAWPSQYFLHTRLLVLLSLVLLSMIATYIPIRFRFSKDFFCVLELAEIHKGECRRPEEWCIRTEPASGGEALRGQLILIYLVGAVLVPSRVCKFIFLNVDLRHSPMSGDASFVCSPRAPKVAR